MTDDTAPGWTVDPELRAAMRLGAVRAAMEREDFEGAVVEAEELLDGAPDHAEALFLLAECLLELGDAELAAPTYERRLELAPPDEQLWTGLAVARFDLTDLSGAIEAAREATRLAPDNAEAHYYLGLALERVEGRKAESVGALMAAHRLDPDAYPLPVEGDPSRWQWAYRRALAALPHDSAQFWEGVEVVFVDLPPLDVLRRVSPPIPPTVPALYSESAPLAQSAEPGQARQLHVYTSNLARLGHWEDITEQLAQILEAEAAGWLEAAEDGAFADDLDDDDA
jgi:tetratricopeptide (TPR) repeat protein